MSAGKPATPTELLTQIAMFRIKICGITSVEDAQAVAAAGADAVGLNFFPRSPRFVDVGTAKQICQALPADVCKVGLFVDATSEEVRERVGQLGLDAVQLHGNESPELLAALSGISIVKALRPKSDLAEFADFLAECRQRQCLPQMVLIDAYHTTLMGGTGERADWQAICSGRLVLDGLPLVLAGGLTHRNVAQAIETVMPQAVDTASGVELSPGKKDPNLVRQFVVAAQLAFEKRTRTH